LVDIAETRTIGPEVQELFVRNIEPEMQFSAEFVERKEKMKA